MLADRKKLWLAKKSTFEEQLTGIDQEIKEGYAQQEARKQTLADHQKLSTESAKKVADQLEKQLTQIDCEVWKAVEALFAHTTNAQFQHIVDNARMTEDHLLTLKLAAKGSEPDLQPLAAWLCYIKTGMSTTSSVSSVGNVAREAIRRWEGETELEDTIS